MSGVLGPRLAPDPGLPAPGTAHGSCRCCPRSSPRAPGASPSALQCVATAARPAAVPREPSPSQLNAEFLKHECGYMVYCCCLENGAEYLSQVCSSQCDMGTVLERDSASEFLVCSRPSSPSLCYCHTGELPPCAQRQSLGWDASASRAASSASSTPAQTSCAG